MQGAEWARLSHPFPPEAFGWYVVELSVDRTQVRLAPFLKSSALFARLDEVVGRSGWSLQLAPLGARALVCNLTVAGVSRAAVAGAPAFDTASVPVVAEDYGGALEPAELAEVAITRCSGLFGVPLPQLADGGWADYDPEAGEPLYTPPLIDLAELSSTAMPSGEDVAVVAAGLEPSAQGEDRPDGHQVIDRLLERLKAEGLGKQAARLVINHNGYGSTPEEARELYGKLRSLLLESSPVAP